MDKRTFIYILALTFVLFGVNFYFQSDREESLRKWQQQQKVKKENEISLLEKSIKDNEIPLKSLPVVSVYGNADATQLISQGIGNESTLFLISWEDTIPETVFVKEEDHIKSYNLSFAPNKKGRIAVYQTENPIPISITDLPVFGSFILQFAFQDEKNLNEPPVIYSGNYNDGQVILFAEKLWKIQTEIGERPNIRLPKNESWVFLQTDNLFLPVGIYNFQTKEMIHLDQLSQLKPYIKQQNEAEIFTNGEKAPESFYLLENVYMQLVFSNYGAALAEINLPFSDKDHPKSVVKEIDFDREIIETHPNNARFPLHSYYTPGNGANQLTKHSKGVLGGYYPLLRRDLIENDNRKSIQIDPKYYSLNIVSEYPELAELVYEVKEFNQNQIVFEAKQRMRTIRKTYSLSQDQGAAPYCFDLKIDIQGDSRGLWLTSGVPEVEWINNAPAPALKYRITKGNKAVVEKLSLSTEPITMSTITPDWGCNSNGFFGIIMDNLSHETTGLKTQYLSGSTVPSRLTLIDQQYNRFQEQKLPGYLLFLPLSEKSGPMEFRIFSGPFSDQILKSVDQKFSNPKTGYNPDYIACQSFHGWFAFISEPFSKFLYLLMKFFHFITGSWAASIVLLTVALRIMLYPLNAWSTKSMVKMQDVAPRVKEIQDKYKKEPKRAQLEIVNLYREAGVNPLSGCFPLLIQMPFLIGMFDLLKSTFSLRGASFIPGWIDNLAAPDVLFSWNVPIFFIGREFHLLPFLLGGIMFLQQRIFSTLPNDPSQWTDQQRQQRAMGTVMAVIFAVMFYHFPSGLNIYWLSSMLLGMLQQWWIKKRMKQKFSTANVEILDPVKPKKKRKSR